MRQMIRALPAGHTLGSGINTAGGAEPGLASARRLNREEIVARLERAGATLLALPAQGYSTHMRQMRFDIIHTALEAYGWESPRLRPPIPDAAAISAMDEAFGWLRLISEESFVLRRIVGARALVHPVTERHLYPWRRLAAALGADHKSVQRWHGNGITILVNALNRRT